MTNSFISAAILWGFYAVIAKKDIALGKRKNLHARLASQCVLGYWRKIEKNGKDHKNEGYFSLKY